MAIHFKSTTGNTKEPTILNIWDTNNRRYLPQFKDLEFQGSMNVADYYFESKRIAVSSDKKYIIFVIEDESIKIYDLLTGKKLYNYKHMGWNRYFHILVNLFPGAVIISPDNTFFISGDFIFS